MPGRSRRCARSPRPRRPPATESAALQNVRNASSSEALRERNRRGRQQRQRDHGRGMPHEMRSGWEYTLNVAPRTKPTSVSPVSRARSIARLDGAETDATSRNAGQIRFLHDLERCPAADAEDAVDDRKFFGEQHAADDLVHGVVPPDVFGDGDELAISGEQSRGVQSAGFVEEPLRQSKTLRHAGQQVRRDREPAANGGTVHRERLDRQTSAQAARRVRGHLPARREEFLQPIDRGPGQGDVEDILRILAVRDRADFVRSGDDALRQEKAGGQLAIGARRAHDHRERPAVQPDFERLFDRRAVGVFRADRALDADDVDRPDRLGHGAHVTLNCRRTDGHEQAIRERGRRALFGGGHPPHRQHAGFSDGTRGDRRLGGARPGVRLLGYVAAGHQHGHHHRDVLDGLPHSADPEQGRARHSHQAERAGGRRQGREQPRRRHRGVERKRTADTGAALRRTGAARA